MKNIFPCLLTIIFAFSMLVGCGGDSADDPKKDDETSTDITFSVTNSGSSAYLFSGNGLSGASNASLTLTRGVTYKFNVSASGHPFWINDTQGTGTGNAYNSGVSGNGAQSGTITFTVPNDAPSSLFYNCQFHSVMTGTITIVDAES